MAYQWDGRDNGAVTVLGLGCWMLREKPEGSRSRNRPRWCAGQVKQKKEIKG